MADKRIQQYPEKTSPSSSDYLLLADNQDVDVNGFLKYKKIKISSLDNIVITNAEDILIANLLNLITNNNLVIGRFYRITDSTSGVNPILVQAVALNILSSIGISSVDGSVYDYDVTTDTVSVPYAGVYVPYTGATTNVDLGEYQIKVGQLELDQTPTGTFDVAKMRWNDTDGTAEIRLKGGNVTLQVGQEQLARVVNKTNTNLTEAGYQVVRISGAQGQRLKVGLAQANSTSTCKDTLGLVTENISNNAEGFITTNGLVRSINTTGSLQGETWADGDRIYLSPSVAGGITNVEPSAPNIVIVLGYVVYAHANQGSIYVSVEGAKALHELFDVSIPTPTNNNVLVYESSTGLWKDKSISTILGYTPIANNATVGGELSGTLPNPSLVTSAVTGKALTGLSVSGSAVVSTDSILTGIGKLQNQINAVLGSVNFQGVWNASTNSPSLASGVGTKGYYYVVSVAGSTNLDGITDWKLGDWAIYDGSAWQKVDNTDAVVSVNGYTGIVTLAAADVNAQPIDATLTALAGLNTTAGMLVQTGTDTFTKRTITGTANQVIVTNGDGVSGNPTLSLPQSIATTSTPQFAKLGLGGNPTASQILRIEANISGSTTTNSVFLNGVIQNDVTSSAYMFRSSPSTLASAFTLTDLSHFIVVQGTIGATSAITEQNGYRIFTNFTGGATNYGFRGQIPSGAGRWNIYMDGTASNHIQGDLLIGTTSNPNSRKLLVSGTFEATGNSVIGGTLAVNGQSQFSTVSIGAPQFSTELLYLGSSSNITTDIRIRNTNTGSSAYTMLGLNASGNSWGIRMGSSAANSNALEFVSDVYGSPVIRGSVSPTSGLWTLNSLSVTNNTTIGGTLGVTGAVTGSSTAQFAKLGLGAAASATQLLRISSNITGGVNAIGVTINSTIQSDVTTSAILFDTFPSTTAASFNLSTLTHYSAATATIGSGSSITNQNGFLVTNLMVGATNNYGFRGQLAAATGRWNIYMDGTANNYFAGNVQIGSTTATAGAEKLQVTGTAGFYGTQNLRVLPSRTAVSNIRAGVGLEFTGNLSLYSSTGTSGEGIDLHYWNGANYFPALTINNVSSGFGTLALMANGGATTIGGTLGITGAATFSSSVSAVRILTNSPSDTGENTIIGGSARVNGAFGINATTNGNQANLLYSSLTSGQNLSFGIGKGISNGNSMFIGWQSTGTNTGYAFLESFGSTSPVVINQGAGKVGIGTTSPVYKTQIVSDGNALLQLNGKNTTGALDTGFTISADDSKNIYLYQRENAFLDIGTNNGSAMRITSSRNVGIGTTSPERRLVVRASDPTDGIVSVVSNNNGGNATTGSKVLFDASGIGNFWEGMPAGVNAWAVGLFNGTTNPEYMRIKSSGVINMSSLPTSSAGLSAGDLWNNGGVVNIV